MKLKEFSDIKVLICRLNRIATTQALLDLNRNYIELTEEEVQLVKDRVIKVFKDNWVGERRQGFWGETLMFINRFWGEHYSKSDDAGKLSIAFPGIAQLFLDEDARHAWNAAMLECIERSEMGEVRVFESNDNGQSLVLSHEDVDYVVAPQGLDVLTEHSNIGKEITHHFTLGPSFLESVGSEAYREAVIESDNYYYRALAVACRIIDDLKDPSIEGFPIDNNLRNRRKYLQAIEALLLARNPKDRIKYAAPALVSAASLLDSANFGTIANVNRLIVQSVPFDIPNHRFITNHGLSEFVRMLRDRGVNVEEYRFPELLAVVGSLAVQVVKRADSDERLIRWEEPLAIKLAELIYELEKGKGGVVALLATAKEYKILLEDAATILTVVYKNQIRC